MDPSEPFLITEYCPRGSLQVHCILVGFAAYNVHIKMYTIQQWVQWKVAKICSLSVSVILFSKDKISIKGMRDPFGSGAIKMHLKVLPWSNIKQSCIRETLNLWASAHQYHKNKAKKNYQIYILYLTCHLSPVVCHLSPFIYVCNHSHRPFPC